MDTFYSLYESVSLIEISLYLIKITFPPILVFLVLRLAYKRVIHFPLVQKMQIPLNMVIVLACISLGHHLIDLPQFAFLGRVNDLLLYLTLFYAVIKSLEIIFIEDILQTKHKVKIPVFVRDIIRFLLLIVAVTILLKVVFGIEASTFLVTSTVISAVIGLALQDMLSNIISGIALQVERPFSVGDWVKINDREGKVHEMSWRSTKIQTRENDFIITPNAAVSQQEIFNFHYPSRLHVVQLYIGTSYNAPPNSVKESLMKILRDVDHILKKPRPEIYLTTYNDFSIDYEIRFWIKDFELVPVIKDDIMTRIWYQFRRDGIEIPFPIRNVNLIHHEARQEQAAQSRQQLLDDIVESIYDIDILEPFSREKLYRLAETVHHEHYTKGEYLVRQGDIDSSFYIIKSGQVDVLVEKDHEVNNVGTFGEDYYFGEISLLTGEPRTASVVAREDTEVLIIDKEGFGALLKENPHIAERMSELLQHRIAEVKIIQEKEMNSATGSSKADEIKDAQKILKRIQRFFQLKN